MENEDINDKKETLEEKFKRCKKHVAATNPKADPWKICAYLNPRISPEKRAQLKKNMNKKKK